MITEEVQSIADVFIVTYSMLDITKMKSDMIRNLKRGTRFGSIFDPKIICKDGKDLGITDSLLTSDEVDRLANYAERMYNRYLQSDNDEEVKELDREH
jgi:hypothetical protein